MISLTIEREILQMMDRDMLAAKKLRQRYNRLHAALAQVNAEMDILSESFICPMGPEFTDHQMFGHTARMFATRMALCRHQPGQEHLLYIGEFDVEPGPTEFDYYKFSFLGRSRKYVDRLFEIERWFESQWANGSYPKKAEEERKRRSAELDAEFPLVKYTPLEISKFIKRAMAKE